jgi:hypothetical protein
MLEHVPQGLLDRHLAIARFSARFILLLAEQARPAKQAIYLRWVLGIEGQDAT